MIIDGNSKVGQAKVYKTELEMHQQKKVDELERSVSWLRESCSEWESWGNDLEKVNKSIETKLAKAVEALKFYGDRRSWKAHNQFKYSDIVDKDIDHANRLHQCGGLKARQTLEEIKKGEEVMTIKEVIAKLKHMENELGGDTLVFIAQRDNDMEEFGGFEIMEDNSAIVATDKESYDARW